MFRHVEHGVSLLDGGAGRGGVLTLRLLVLALAPALVAAAPPPVWKAQCQVCHQADGAGLSGQFPRLKGRADVIAATPAGRAYLSTVVVHGLAGRISVDGKTIIGVMPGFATLSDADLAAALNHVAGKGMVKAADVAAARKQPASNSTLVATRAALVADGTIP